MFLKACVVFPLSHYYQHEAYAAEIIKQRLLYGSFVSFALFEVCIMKF